MCRLLVTLILIVGSNLVSAQTQRIESDRFHYFIGPPPAWVASPSPTSAANPTPGEPIQYLSHDVQVDVESETQYVAKHFRILKSEGIEKLSEISIDYVPDYQSLTLHKIAVVRDGKTQNRLNPTAIRLIQAENNLDSRIFSGTATAIAILRDVRVGDEVIYAYSRRGRNPVFGDRYASGFSAGWQVPVASNRIRVRVPIRRTLYYRSHGIDLAPTITREGGYKNFVWQQTPTEPVSDEGQYPRWYQPYPWIQISEYRNWAEVATWANALFQGDGTLPNAVREKLHRWQSGGKEQALLKALRFVQEEIRYLGLELGEYSHRPAPPATTLERRYGDCKDKALLLVTLLRKLGIEAYPALVSFSHRRGIEQLLPSHYVFDHAIVMARLRGQTYWLDATRTHQRGRLNTLGFTRFGKALVVAPSSHELVTVEAPKGFRNGTRVEERFLVTQFEAPVELQVVSVHSGNRADWQRGYFANRSLAEIGRTYINYYARQWPKIEPLAPLEIEDDERSNHFTIHERYRISDFWDHEQGALVASLRAGTIRDFISLPDTIARHSPLALTFPVILSHTSILQLPTGMTVKGKDRSVKIEDSHITYRVETHHDGNRFEVRHRLRTLADHVSADRVGTYVQRINSIWDHMTYVYYAPYDDKVVSNDMVRDLIDKLGRLKANR